MQVPLFVTEGNTSKVEEEVKPFLLLLEGKTLRGSLLHSQLLLTWFKFLGQSYQSQHSNADRRSMLR